LCRAYRVGVWLVLPGTTPAPGFYKRWLIRQWARRARTPILVETGTLHGGTVASCVRSFDRIISIEIDPLLARRAIERFADVPHVTIIEGDSTSTLPTVVAELEAPATFWFDGHYSGHGTGRGAVDPPIVAEVTAVLGSGKPAVVLIDDARLFVGAAGYPTLSELEELVRDLRSSATFAVTRDIVRVNAMKAW
jgi:hypothetical protein